ncbi:MAG: tetratricopeptide repeat protein [Spirochaetaceae bacterium]|jgi:tetratricopeptide (TPR) repeat protein|nr:tetratricopeptide repeat protein [Spirochaetaceae bacterium]
MDFDGYLREGKKFLNKEEYLQAIEMFGVALILQPDNQEVRELAITAANKQTSQLLANEAKDRAESMGIKVEDIDKAIAECTEESKLSIFYYIRGLISESKGERSRAIADYSKAIKNEPDYPLAFKKRGNAYLDNGDFDEAIADFEELIRLNKKYNQDNNAANVGLGRAYMERGVAYYKKGKSEEAIADWNKVFIYKPDDPNAKGLIEMAKAEKCGNSGFPFF